MNMPFLERSKCFLEEKCRIAKIVSRKPAVLESFRIDDEGYQARIKVRGVNITRQHIYKVVDDINFKGFVVNDVLYYEDALEVILVPATQETMTNFIWGYIELYLSDSEETEALAAAIGVLEHMVEDMPVHIQNIFDDYVRNIIQ